MGVWIVDKTASLDVSGEQKIFYARQDLNPSTIQPQRAAVPTTLSWSPVIRWCFVNISGYYLRSVKRITENQGTAPTIHTLYINMVVTTVCVYASHCDSVEGQQETSEHYRRMKTTYSESKWT